LIAQYCVISGVIVAADAGADSAIDAARASEAGDTVVGGRLSEDDTVSGTSGEDAGDYHEVAAAEVLGNGIDPAAQCRQATDGQR
jgi:hypothetical protein